MPFERTFDMPLRLASSLAGMAAALAATPALALSCLAPSVTDAFARANAAEEVYTIVLGTLSGGLPPRPGLRASTASSSGSRPIRAPSRDR